MGWVCLVLRCCSICEYKEDIRLRAPPQITQKTSPNLSKIARQLEAYAYVVLHASDLAADGDRVLLEGGDGGLELVRVDLHLLPELHAHGLGVSGHQGVPHMQPVWRRNISDKSTQSHNTDITQATQ